MKVIIFNFYATLSCERISVFSIQVKQFRQLNGWEKHLEMYGLIAVSATGIMGIAALVDNQYDLSFLDA